MVVVVVVVVVMVGCGKSSLLSACLDEMKKLKGHVNMKVDTMLVVVGWWWWGGGGGGGGGGVVVVVVVVAVVVVMVGCGKSSLLSACLDEMKKLKGHVSMKVDTTLLLLLWWWWWGVGGGGDSWGWQVFPAVRLSGRDEETQRSRQHEGRHDVVVVVVMVVVVGVMVVVVVLVVVMDFKLVVVV